MKKNESGNLRQFWMAKKKKSSYLWYNDFKVSHRIPITILLESSPDGLYNIISALL